MDFVYKHVHWLLRATLALTFVLHGYPKLGGNLDMGVIGYLVGPFEVFGAIFIIIGPFVNDMVTRIGALMIAVIMLGAIFIVHINDGWFGVEWQTLIFSSCMLFVIKGNDV
tara:strand:+ start:679 stop:1011 length:333 start_codon:yes stop_codon:yes gene_type:complete